MELSDGNGRRGEEHITFADEMIKEADSKSLDILCQDPKLQDRDKDGIIDSEDKCPDTPGKREYKGCPDPDIDKDGVCDAWVAEMNLQKEFPCQGIDACPNDPGELAYMGCSNPDRDSDGICDQWVSASNLQDKFKKQCKDKDLCEDVAGLAEYQGCPNPDSDKDGVCDPWVAERNLGSVFTQCVGSDKCPFEKGVVEENGCPPENTSSSPTPRSNSRNSSSLPPTRQKFWPRANPSSTKSRPSSKTIPPSTSPSKATPTARVNTRATSSCLRAAPRASCRNSSSAVSTKTA